MEIKTPDYHIHYDSNTTTIHCKGSLRLGGMDDYAPIIELLNYVADQNLTTITLDLQQLEFLNSSGINVLSKFVIKIRQKKTLEMIVRGSKKIPWQSKSLTNLQRLMPTLQLELN